MSIPLEESKWRWKCNIEVQAGQYLDFFVKDALRAVGVVCYIGEIFHPWWVYFLIFGSDHQASDTYQLVVLSYYLVSLCEPINQVYSYK